MDYKKFNDVRRAIANPFKFDLFYEGNPVVRARIGSPECVAGKWIVEAWFPGNPKAELIEIEKITYKPYTKRHGG